MNSAFTVHNSEICLPKSTKAGQKKQKKKKKRKRELEKRRRSGRGAQTLTICCLDMLIQNILHLGFTSGSNLAHLLL